jgi:UPF0271 protein
VARCRAGGADVGAHPSYPDRAGFGRHRLDLPPDAVGAAVAAQCALLAGIARWLKPHGALYHAADADPALAAAVVDGALRGLGRPVTVIGPAGGALAAAAAARGLAFAREGFADRGRGPDGRLIPRGQPGDLITDPTAAAAQTRALLATIDTVCVHGDTPGAVAIARAVRAVLG